jgi:hypothetical protein
MLSSAKRRFGEGSDQVKRMEGEDGENSHDEYREVV